MAGKIPELVMGLMLEDPPFFNVQPGEFENTFVYKDSFKVIHDFINQIEKPRYFLKSMKGLEKIYVGIYVNADFNLIFQKSNNEWKIVENLILSSMTKLKCNRRFEIHD